MKKNPTYSIAVLIALLFLACNSSNQAGAAPNPESALQRSHQDTADPVSNIDNGSQPNKILIVYFTRANNVDQPLGVDVVSRASFNVQRDGTFGNTELLARYIYDAIGGDLLSLRVTPPYPYDVDETIANVAGGDPRRVSTDIGNIDQYDTVFIGYPNWNGTLPEPVSRFLREYDFSGKTILPFSTHRGSRFGRSIRDLESALPNSTFLEGYTVGGDDAHGARQQVNAWLRNTGFIN